MRIAVISWMFLFVEHMLMRRSFGLLRSAVACGINRSAKSPVILPRTCLNYSYLARNMAYNTRESGCLFTTDYKMYFEKDGHVVSPFHDIPLFANNEKTTYNMVVEIPRWTNAKMEIATKQPMNPIKQDVKKGNVRFVNHCFPYHGYIWNYGALPQTWEDPDHKDEGTGCMGDNDPIDACEIGTKVSERGDVKQVKVLGILAMIDEGETDWKVICIDVNDPLAGKINDINEVEEHMPGLLKATVDWFRIYKVPAGKPFNEFAYDAEFKNKEFCRKIIEETHKSWEQLVMNSKNTQGLVCKNVTVKGSPCMIGQEEAEAFMNLSQSEAQEAQALCDDVDQWHYVKRT